MTRWDMKIMVVHDAKGLVKSAGVAGERFAGRVRLVADTGEEVSEIEAPDAPGLARAGDTGEDAGVRHLVDLVNRTYLRGSHE
jgi:hypothetical protein